MAHTTCEIFMAHARYTPNGENPIWFKNKFPKAFTPPFNIPGTPWDKRTMQIASRGINV